MIENRYYLLLCFFFVVPIWSFVLYPEAQVFAKSESVDVQSSTHNSESGGNSDDSPLPVVIWHGLGDSATNDGIKDVSKLVDEVHPGTYVHIISLSESGGDDQQTTFFGNVNDQIDMVCEQLAKDRILSSAPAIDAIGFSQGGQFLRGYVQRCGKLAPKVRSLITFGSQHNGITEFQKCKSATDFFCHAANNLLKGSLIWSDYVQTRVVPAQYYRNLEDFDMYLEHSNFLADINNERATKNATYAKNLAELEKFVMILFEDDQTVIPKESGWFAEIDDAGKIIPLHNQSLYKDDWIGLKQLDEKGALIFESVKGEHMRLTDKDLKSLFTKYFGPVTSSTIQRSAKDFNMQL